ncbi:MAG: hypothetical protein ABSA30_00105 [Candidatus Aminicenantales bacterium]|jgi:hypothetical protein
MAQVSSFLSRLEGKLDHVVELATTTAARTADMAAIVLGDSAHTPITDRVGSVETDVEVLKTHQGIWTKVCWTTLGALGTYAATHAF